VKLDPGTTVERYVVEEVLGAGGTAMVYLVRHTALGTRHALKVLTLTSSAIRERMLREGQVQASLNHPNVVAVTDVIDIQGQPGLLMEHIVGPSLERALSKYKLTMGDAEILFQGILAGVRAAHDTGLVHRDLKPANVLLQRTQAGFVPKVTDFGLAKLLQADPEVAHTRSGIAMGTPSYMAPEQIRDARSVDQRADVWSLGCLLYELMTRRRTFPGDEALAIYNAVTEGRFVPPRKVVGGLPERVEKAIHGCLTVDRDARIPDCATLEAVLSGEVDWALPENLGEPTANDTPTVVKPRPMPPGARIRERTTGGPSTAGSSVGGGPSSGGPSTGGRSGAGLAAASSRGGSTGGGLMSGGLVSGGAIEEVTDRPHIPPPLDASVADDAETVLVSRSAIDGTLLPDNAHVGDSLDDAQPESMSWWVYLLVGVGALGVALLLLFAFGAAVMSTVLNERLAGFGSDEDPALRGPARDPATRGPAPSGTPTKPASTPDPATRGPAPSGTPTSPAARDPATRGPAPSGTPTKPESTPDPAPASKPDPAPVSKPDPKPVSTPDPKPSTPDPKPEPGPAPAPVPAPTAPEPAPTTDAAGRVRVVFGSTPPGADLWVGGYKRSRTPASIDLQPGAYEVMMQQRGGQPKTFEVQVGAGESNNWCYDFANAGVTAGSCPAIGPGSFSP